MIFYTITTTGVTLAIFIEYFLYALIIIGGFSIVGFIFLLFLKKDVISELPPLILLILEIWVYLFAYSLMELQDWVSPQQ